ncbi:hypothetical protein U27_06298 [Candidatus Vecturithrix granuli]|uniref:Uncharacterized protein n=1 Tax=Vecturithrix granuli TaxID=1499967 RepID=A0A081C409_VECG1|nr:hypothetical protein U27_06298 [Candidatus Vecturithrix granuli]
MTKHAIIQNVREKKLFFIDTAGEKTFDIRSLFMN